MLWILALRSPCESFRQKDESYTDQRRSTRIGKRWQWCTAPSHQLPSTVSRCSVHKSQAPMTSMGHHIDFNAPAVLRKWPSLKNERRTESHGAYLVVDGTLNECIRSFMAKPVSIRHLYEVHTSPQPPLVEPVLSGEIVAELARLQDFL